MHTIFKKISASLHSPMKLKAVNAKSTELISAFY